MCRASRFRRSLRWLSATACVLTAAAWLYTRLGGTLSLGHDPDVNLPRFVLTEGCIAISPGLGWVNDNPPYQVYLGYIPIPLLGILVVLALPTILLWLPTRIAPPVGRCRHCGYNLTGNVSGVCPECGTAVAEATLRERRKPSAE